MESSVRHITKENLPRIANKVIDDFNVWRKNCEGKFAVEVGCGVGFHSIQWAKANTCDQILAVERTTGKFKKFEQRLLYHPDLKNVFSVHADAGVLLPQLLLPETVDTIFVLYPNPYPKAKHSNLRFAFSPLTLFFVDVLKFGGELIFATNLDWYKNELVESVPQRTRLRIASVEKIDVASRPRSHFEKKYLEHGETCWNIVLK